MQLNKNVLCSWKLPSEQWPSPHPEPGAGTMSQQSTEQAETRACCCHCFSRDETRVADVLVSPPHWRDPRPGGSPPPPGTRNLFSAVPSSWPVSFLLQTPASWALLLGEELQPHMLHPCSLAPDVFHTHPAAMSTRTPWEGVATDLLGAWCLGQLGPGEATWPIVTGVDPPLQAVLVLKPPPVPHHGP